ncbi:MAG: hypothetical protein H6760_04380 [Candidatus Nomurabacteria bacterium]|nr:MAG: hypothetical protein H6760_04380 [Candidatus Nomurabacteria bacterium]
MSKALIAIIIGVLVLGGGYFVWQSQSGSDETSDTTSNSDSHTMMESSSLTSLFGQNDDLTCDYTYSDEYGSQEGVVYMHNNMVRGDFMMVANDGAETESHIIRDDTYHYNWGMYDGQEIGTKIKLEDFDTEADTNETDTTDTNAAPSVNYDNQYDFDCHPWTVDAAKFELPSNVEFTDLTAQMEAMHDAMEETMQAQCSSCDSLEGEAKTSCLAALGC